MAEGNERSAIPLRLHTVLLALAGRLDDSALGQARRLAARARTDEAAELITGSLVAGRIPVRAAEQRELAALLAAAGADDWFAEQLLVDDEHEPVEHRFSGGGSAGIAEALDAVLRRLPDVRGVYAVWRNTVAGSVPGPMPQRMVLAEVGPDGSPLATAYRMDTALRRAGFAATVEVTTAGAARGAYHRQALNAADRITGSEARGGYDTSYAEPSREPEYDQHEPEPPPAAPEPVREPEPEAREPEPEAREPEPEPERPVSEPVRAVEPEPEPAAAPEPWAETPPASAGEQAANELEPGELFWPQADPGRQPEAVRAVPAETRAEQTTEITGSELGLLRSAIGKAADRTTITGPAQDPPTKITGADTPTHVTEPAEQARASMEFPSNDLDNPRLSVRDRELLRELHAELAKREREQASQVRLNGWEPGAAR